MWLLQHGQWCCTAEEDLNAATVVYLLGYATPVCMSHPQGCLAVVYPSAPFLPTLHIDTAAAQSIVSCSLLLLLLCMHACTSAAGLKKDKQGITQQQPGNAAATSGTGEPAACGVESAGAGTPHAVKASPGIASPVPPQQQPSLTPTQWGVALSPAAAVVVGRVARILFACLSWW